MALMAFMACSNADGLACVVKRMAASAGRRPARHVQIVPESLVLVRDQNARLLPCQTEQRQKPVRFSGTNVIVRQRLDRQLSEQLAPVPQSQHSHDLPDANHSATRQEHGLDWSSPHRLSDRNPRIIDRR